jgi:hypothetical protein
VESRTRFAIGGMSTVVASVAVICAVALTNTVALSDSAGVPVKATPVVVPSPSASADVARVPASVAPRTSAALVVPDAEAVPAPAPIAVTTTAPSATSEPTSAAAVAEAEESGSWEPVRAWANGNGWSQNRIDAWIQRLEEKRPAAADRISDDAAPQPAEIPPADEAGRLTASESPEISAQADEGTERRSAKSDAGSKKTQSRDSPDRRD